jgi:hypothetical protein
MPKLKFPNKIKIGRVIYEISDDEDYLNGDQGAVIEDESTIFIDLDNVDCPGEVLFHEIVHAIEDTYNLKLLWNNDSHTVFLSILYTVLRENGLLNKRLYMLDKIEGEIIK